MCSRSFKQLRAPIPLAAFAAALLASGALLSGTVHAAQPQLASKPPVRLPVYDHIVIVMEENKDYADVIGRPEAPYINSVLAKEGAVFTKMYGEEHFSEGNYFWLLSGANQGIGFKDGISLKKTHAKNLAHELSRHGHSFAGFSEGLPKATPEAEFSADHLYARKHVPWVSFSNIPKSAHRSFEEFPATEAGFAKLPTLAIVVPNQENDMHNIHNGGKPEAVYKGDKWLKMNLDAYYQWAKKNNSLLILTFDENDDPSHYSGLTNPGIPALDRSHLDLINQIPTIFAGAHIKPGKYPETPGITHVNILRTLEAMYHLPKSGTQQQNAASAGMKDDHIMADVFEKPAKL